MLTPNSLVLMLSSPGSQERFRAFQGPWQARPPTSWEHPPCTRPSDDDLHFDQIRVGRLLGHLLAKRCLQIEIVMPYRTVVQC